MVSKQWRNLFKKDYLKSDGSLIKVSDMLEGTARKENEDFEKYKIRRAAEKQLLRDYRGGLMIPNEWDFSNSEEPKPKPYRKVNG